MSVVEGVNRWRRAAGALVGLATVVAMSSGARATVSISTAATAHMNCVSGVCTATASDAVLNAAQLQRMLALSNVTVATGPKSETIVIAAAIGWSSARALTLNARQSVAIDQPVSVSGKGDLTVVTGSGGTFSFGAMGNVHFANLSSVLRIDGVRYTLFGTVKSLAAHLAAKPAGAYALANAYDAAGDGTYKTAPVDVAMAGIVDGLGNTISHLKIVSTVAQDEVGLFAGIGIDCPSCAVRNLRLVAASIAAGASASVGGLLGVMDSGTIFNCSVNGSVTGGDGADAGGLVGGMNAGTISRSHATGSVRGGTDSEVGGLVGYSNGGGTIEASFAAVTVAGKTGAAGGLAGHFQGLITTSFATGAVSSGAGSDVGGLVGTSQGGVTLSYATGNATAGADSFVGGLAGQSTNGVSMAFATGTATGGGGSYIGGLIGVTNQAAIGNCYATGNALEAGGGTDSSIGGLVGFNTVAIGDCYSTGAVGGGTTDTRGGSIGADGAFAGSVTHTYWDTISSGLKIGEGSGNNAPKGQTTTQLKARLPVGFAKTIWARSPGINGGLPYLIANPPP